ncbi:MAG TPA: YMGG-like glycine zipper-containing protein [Pyrinomonadaceae bacterium]|nr:YMGG-like glycine zipper-containing protein [Pyrinomonadaceae bacterium]
MNQRARLLITLILVFAFPSVTTVTSLGQKKSKPKRTFYSVPANSTMHVRLNQELKSEKAQVGDVFTSTLVDPVYSSNGVVLAPQGSIITGRVTNVQRAQKNGKPATMDVAFVSLKLPNGYVRQINGSLAELTSSSGSSSDNEGTITAKKTSHRKVKFIGGGAAGGAVIGAIAGGGKGLAIGAGVGALAGAITGRVKKGSEVKVSSGTEFGVILNQATSLPRYAAAQ